MSTALSTDLAFRQDVFAGLRQARKTLPCKYLYDENGSALFDQICDLDEYYPTRTELQIMSENAVSIADQIGTGAMLVEYGSGSSTKTRLLLDSLEEPAAYVPVDISEEHLLRTAESLRCSYPSLEVLPVVADFTRSFELPSSRRDASHVALYFPGSTIGNFTPQAAGAILESMSKFLGRGGGLLIGVDLQKEVSVIEAAYNDAEGVTAAFNLNLLARINRELDSNFDLAMFAHRAVYNDTEHRIEITIQSLREQTVRVGNQRISFAAGEEILTEYSHKYTIEGFAKFASRYGFTLHHHWTDPKDYFGVLHLVLEGASR